MILVSSQKQMMIWSAFLLTNLAGLLIILLSNPDLVGEYPSSHARTIDSFYSLIIALVIVLYFVLYSKRNYLRHFLKAKESDQLKNSFLANLSHEIRTPLNSIMGFSELLLDPNDREDLETKLKVINTNSEYLLCLIDDVLDLARIESGELPLVMENGNAVDLIRKLEIDYTQRIQNQCPQSIQLQYVDTGSKGEIRTDFKRMEQVFRNLLDNALKFTHNGYIHIYYTEEKERVIVKIQDTGIGIGEEEVETVFKRFVKGKQDLNRNHRGVGIGLSLCKQLLEAMGGDISVVSVKGQGSTFTFTLPR
jgi:signal transduction histidine kinase